jgi:hypothetical protein
MLHNLVTIYLFSEEIAASDLLCGSYVQILMSGRFLTGHWWLMFVILATWEAEMWRIVV